MQISFITKDLMSSTWRRVQTKKQTQFTKVASHTITDPHGHRVKLYYDKKKILANKNDMFISICVKLKQKIFLDFIFSVLGEKLSHL